MVIDTSTAFGANVHARLIAETVAWLTTVGKDGTPHPKPVWFLLEGETILIYSQANAAKLAHIARNPRVSLNLNGNGTDGNYVVFTGSAVVDSTAPAADAIPAYVEKYRAGIPRIGMTPESFAAAYSVAIRFTPEKLSGL